MEQVDFNTIQQQELYKKLVDIIPNLAEHLTAGTPRLEAKINGDRTLDYLFDDKESDDAYFITLEQSDDASSETQLLSRMEIRISLKEQTAIPMGYINSYEDMRVELDGEGDSLPNKEHSAEVYDLCKSWLNNLNERQYRVGRLPESTRNISRPRQDHTQEREQ